MIQFEALEQRVIADMSLFASAYGVNFDFGADGSLSYDHLLRLPAGDADDWANATDLGQMTGGEYFTDSGLASDSRYEYGLFNEADWYDQGPYATPDATVTVQTAVAATWSSVGDQITLNWTSGDPSHQYTIDRQNADGSWSQVGSVGAATSFTDTPPTAGSFNYRVHETTGGTTSDVVTASTGPDAPTGLTATAASPGEVDLSWTDNSHPINLFRSTDPSFSTYDQIAANAMGNSFADQTARGNTTYYYKAQATDGNAVSALSAATSVTTPAPAAPTQLSAAIDPATAGHVEVSWTPGVGAAKTLIERSTDAGSTWSAVGTVDVDPAGPTAEGTLLDTGAPASGTILYRATSEDSTGGAGATSASVTAAPLLQTSASASATTVTGTTVNLSVLGGGGTGLNDFTYTWAATQQPNGAPDPFFSDNGDDAARNVTATFFQAGSYTLRATVADGPIWATSDVTLTVNQTLTSLTLTPGGVGGNVGSGGDYALAATALDQFQEPMPAAAATVAWSVAAGSAGSVTATAPDGSTADYSAPAALGTDTVTATADDGDGHTATASTPLTVTGDDPVTALPSAPLDVTARAQDGTDVQVAWTRGLPPLTFSVGGSDSGQDGPWALLYGGGYQRWYGDNADTQGFYSYNATLAMNSDGTGWLLTLEPDLGGPSTVFSAPAVPGSLLSPASASAWSVLSTDCDTTPYVASDLQLADTSPALDGYLIEGSTDNGVTWQPLGTAAAGDTSFLATDLCANSDYVFRVTPFNAAGRGAAGTAGCRAGSQSAAGWYKVGFNDPSNPAATSEPITIGPTAFTNVSGTLTLDNGGWVQADSMADAVRKAISGSVTSHDGGYGVVNTFAFGHSGAFAFNPDLHFGGHPDTGPAVVMEDEFNETGHGDQSYTDVYVPVSVTLDDLYVQATDDPSVATSFLPPAGSSVVGVFDTGDPDSSSYDYAATVSWPDRTTTSGQITNDGNGNLCVTVVPPLGESLAAYTLQVTHLPDGVTGSDAVGMTLPAGSQRPVKMHAMSPTPTPAPVITSSGVQGTSVTLDFTGSGHPRDVYYLYRSTSLTYLANQLASPRGGRLVRVTLNGQPVHGRVYRGQPFIQDDARTQTLADLVPLQPSKLYYYAIVGSGAPTSPSNIYRVRTGSGVAVPAPWGVTVQMTGGTYPSTFGDYGTINTSSSPPNPAHGVMPQAHIVSWNWTGNIGPGQTLTFTLVRYNTGDGTATHVFDGRSSSDPSLHGSGSSYSFTDPIAVEDNPDPAIYEYAVTASIGGISSQPSMKAFAPQIYYIMGFTEQVTQPNCTGTMLQTYYGSDRFTSQAPKPASEFHFFRFDDQDPQNTVKAVLGSLARQGGGSFVLAGFSFGGWAAKLVADTGTTVDYLALFDPVPDTSPIPSTIELPDNVLDANDWFGGSNDSVESRPMSSQSHPALGDADHNKTPPQATFHGSQLLLQDPVDTVDSKVTSPAMHWYF